MEYNFRERSSRPEPQSYKEKKENRPEKEREREERGREGERVRTRDGGEREEIREKSLSLSLKPAVEDEANQVTAVAYVRCTPKPSPREHHVETRYPTLGVCA